MSNVVLPLAIVGGGIFLTIYYTSRSETERGAKLKGQRCNEDFDCSGGTLFGAHTRCIDGECTPLVQEDTAVGVWWNPKDKGIRQYCGKYYLQGEAGKCDSDSQCSSDGIVKTIDKAGASFATGRSMYYCNSLGRCDSKCKNFLGTYWRRQDVPNPSALTCDKDRKYENMAESTRVFKTMGKTECANEFGRDQPSNWDLVTKVDV